MEGSAFEGAQQRGVEMMICTVELEEYHIYNFIAKK